MLGTVQTIRPSMPCTGHLRKEQMPVPWWQVHWTQDRGGPTALCTGPYHSRAGNNQYANRTQPRQCPAGSVGVHRLCPWDVHGSKDPRSPTRSNRTSLPGASSHISKSAHRTCKTRFIVFMGPIAAIWGVVGTVGGPIFGKLTPAPGPLQPSLQVLAMPRIARILAGLTKVAYKLQFENV